MAEAEVKDKAEAKTQHRYDTFRYAKPYYGAPVLEVRDNVPTLFSLSVRCVFSKKIKFAVTPTVPPVIKSRLEYLKRYEYFSGPRIMKCSKCEKFYTSKHRFLTHDCLYNAMAETKKE